ncbi:hypothetical protein [Cryptosporangium aurantiacum]|uniref:Uncharacterized protein n=1 Tax=Cryptosporangium aurantiacum TaxID=134849 RepID=A0A1M7RKC1_9ACTN|nr:hypothetical protein [Cryptosporangium aurantiacum]SHN46596.1 hypothetical protein SAMN05443668_116132 [Cryptosporangium aurantiacum]
MNAGSRWVSTTGPTEVLIVRPPSGQVELRCGGELMAPSGSVAREGVAHGGEPLLLGKRYTDAASGLQLLCTKPGPGPVEVDGRPVERLDAKPLPASD